MGLKLLGGLHIPETTTNADLGPPQTPAGSSRPAISAASPTIATGLGEGEARIFYFAYWRRCWLPARSPDVIGAALRAAGRLPRSARAIQVPPRHRGLVLVTHGSVAAAHAAGLAVHVWTIDEPVEMRRLLALGTDGMTSNRPAVARKVIDGG